MASIAPERLHDELAVLDPQTLMHVGDAAQLLTRSVGKAPTESIVALARRIEECAVLRCALCQALACEGRVLRLHLRADAAMEARFELEELVRAAGLALLDPRGPELSASVRLGDDEAVAYALTVIGGEPPAYVLLESEDDTAIFVQVFANDRGAPAHAEAVSARHLEGRAFDRATLARLRLLGWRGPNASCANHHLTVDVANEKQRLELARLLARTLREAYGVRDGAPLTMRAFSLGETTS